MKLPFSLHKKHYPIGVDIGSSSIKLVQVATLPNGGLVIRGYTQVPLPKGAIIEDTVTDMETVKYVLRTALDKPKFGSFAGNRVAVALPESKSFVRVIHLPKMSDAEIDNTIPFEAESYIPIPIDQVYLDWQKIGEEPDRFEVLLIATPKESTEKRLAVFDAMKLQPQALEVESQSLQRALISAEATPTVLIADIDQNKTNLVMIEKGKLLFTSSIPIGGGQFTDVIAKHANVSAEKAETIKQSVGFNNTEDHPNMKQAMLPVLDNLTAEIKNVLNFQTEHSKAPTEAVLLCGGGSRLKNITESLSPALNTNGVVVRLADPMIKLQKEGLLLDPIESLDYTTAIGLALRNEY